MAARLGSYVVGGEKRAGGFDPRPRHEQIRSGRIEKKRAVRDNADTVMRDAYPMPRVVSRPDTRVTEPMDIDWERRLEGINKSTYQVVASGGGGRSKGKEQHKEQAGKREMNVTVPNPSYVHPPRAPRQERPRENRRRDDFRAPQRSEPASRSHDYYQPRYHQQTTRNHPSFERYGREPSRRDR